MASRRPDPELWRDIRWLSLAVGMVLFGYTVLVYISPDGDLFDWFNTLISTAASVIFALVIGLILFHYQTREADRAKKEQLVELLRIELDEVRRVIENSQTVVPDEALETTEISFTSHAMYVSLHYTHPLIVEEAARSGLFDTEQTAEMLALARNMRSHNLRVQEITALRLYEEKAMFASDDRFSAQSLRALKMYAEAGRSVQRSEERIVNGCQALLDSL